MALTYNIQFNADTKSLQSQLRVLQADLNKAFDLHLEGEIGKELNDAVRSAQALETALKKATTVNGTSFVAMNAELRKMGTSAAEVVTNLSSAQMRNAASQFINTFTFADRSALVLSGRIKEIGRVITQSFKFSMAQDFLRFMNSALDSGIRWSKDMNEALTNISIVTQATGEDLSKIFDNILKGAQTLRIAAKEYAEAALIFYQQGLDEGEVQRRTDITLKASKAAGQSVTEMSEQLTAVWNTYKMEGDALERAASIGARLGAETAVDFKYIAEAMQSSASAASQLGVSYESLGAIIATVGETTLQSASTVGNAYKTIFSRFANLKTTGEDMGVTLGQITEQFADMGINVLDSSGELRELDDVIMELGLSWDNYSVKQQQAIAQIAGGTRQFGQFLALMNNFDKYQANLQSAMSEVGGETLSAQFDVWSDSIEAAANRAKEAWAQGFAEMFQQDSIKGFYNLVEGLGKVFGDVVKGLGGLPGLLAVAATIMQKQIVTGAKNLLISSQEYLKSLTLQGKINVSNQKIAEQRAATDKAFYATSNAGMESELLLLGRKLATTEKINTTVVQLQNLQKNGNLQQQQEATTQLQLLETMQQRHLAALDENQAAKLELELLQSALGAEELLTEQEREQLRLAELRVRVAGQRVDETETGFNAAAEDAAEAAKQGAKGAQSFTQSLMGVATGAMMAAMAVSQFSSMLKGETEVSVGSVLSLIMSLGMALLSLIPAISSLVPALYAMVTGQTAVGVSAGAMGAAIWAALLPILPIILAIVAALALIVGVGMAIAQGIENASPEKKLADARDSANQLKSELEETTAAAEELHAAFDNFQSLEDNLDQLVVGTQEWKDALKETNEAAIDLLNKYPELAKFADRSGGQIKFSKEGLEEIAKTADASVAKAKVASTLANQQLREAQAAVDQANINKELGNQRFTGPNWGAVGTGAAVGAAAGAATGIGAVVGGIGGAIVGGFAGESMQDTSAAKALEDAVGKFTGELSKDKEAFAAELRNQGITNQETVNAYIDQMESSHDDITAWKEAIEANTRIRELENQQMAADILGETITSSAAGEQITKVAGDMLADLTDKYTKQFTDAAGKRGMFNTGTDESKQAWEQYAKEMGLKDAKVTNYKGSGNIEYEYTDEKGEVQKTEVTAKQVGITLAAAKAQEELGNITKELVATYDQLARSTNDADQALLQFLGNKDLTEATKGEFQDLAGEIEKAGGAAEYLNEKFGGDDGVLSNEEAYALSGYESAQAWADALKAGVDEATTSWETIDLPPDLIGVEGLGLSASKKLQDLIKQASVGAMAEGGDAMVAGFNKIIEGIDAKSWEDLAKKQGQALEVLSNVDWSSWDGANDARNKLDALGISTNMTADEWQNFVNQMREANNASPIDAMQDLLVTMQELYAVTSELEFGDIISDEDYQKLIAYDATLKDMFLTMMDGSHKLIGDADMVKNLNIEDAIVKLQEASDLYNKFKAAGWGHEENGVRVSADWESYAKGEGNQLGTLQNLQKSADFMSIADMLGYDPAEIQQIIDDVEKAGGAATDASKKLFESLNEFANDTSLADVSERTKEMLASTATSIQELNDMMASDAISSEAYQKAWLGLVGSVQQCKEALEDISSSDFSGSLQEQVNQLELLNAQMQALGVTGLTEDFLTLTDAEQDQVLALKRLESAQNEYNDAVSKAGPSSLAAGVALKNMAKATGDAFDLNADNLQSYTKHIMNAAKNSDYLSESLQTNQKAALQVATATIRANRGFADLDGKLGDIKKAFKEADAGSERFYDALNDIRGPLEDILNVDPGTLSEGFLSNVDNLDLLEQALNGNVDALWQLQQIAASTYLEDLFNDNLLEGIDITLGELKTLEQAFLDTIDAGWGLGEIPDPELDPTGFLAAADEIITKSGMTVQQANDYFKQLGFDMEFNTEKKTVPGPEVTIPETTEVVTTKPNWVNYPIVDLATGNVKNQRVNIPSVVRSTIDTTHTVAGPDQEIDVWAAAAKDSGKGLVTGATNTGSAGTKGGKTMRSKPNRGSGGAGTGGGGKGGGGSEPKKVTGEAKSYGERYRDTGDALENISRRLDKVSTAADKAFGLNKLRLLAKTNSLLQEQAKMYQQLQKEAENYLKGSGGRPVQFGKGFLTGSDQSILQDMSKTLGFGDVLFDEEGFVKNAEVMKNAAHELAMSVLKDKATFDAEEGAWVFGTDEAGEANKKYYEDLTKQIDQFFAQLDVNNESATKALEAHQKQIEIIHDWLSNKIAETDLRLELGLRINQMDLRQLEFLLDRLGDRAGKIKLDKLNESATIAIDTGYKLIANYNRLEQIIGNINNISDWSTGDHQAWFKQEFGDKAWDEFMANGGAFTQEMMDNLLDKAGQMQDVIEQLYDYSEKMFGSFREALDLYIADFDRLIATYDNHATMLDAWTTLWKVAGEPWKNRRMEIELMNKSIDNQTSKVKGLQQQHEFLKGQLDNAERVYLAAKAAHGDDDKITQQALQSWLDLQAQVESTGATVMSEIANVASMFEEKAAMMAEVIRSEFASALNGLFAEMSSFGDMFSQRKTMDQFFMNAEDAGLALGKLLQETMDNPDLLKDAGAWEQYLNSMIEKRIVQTEILGEMREHEVWVTKDGVQLTEKQLKIIEEQFELEKQQAAFQEQQEMKKTMRLARDASGNWSYVYSADDKASEDKAQQIEDRLANIRKMHREAVDELTNFWADQMIEWEEFEANVDQKRYAQDERYRAQVDTQRAWYQEMMGTLATQIEIHLDAIDMDFTETTLSTILNLDDMSDANDLYTQNIKDMSEAFQQNWQDNQTEMHAALEEMGIDMNDFEDTVRTETDAIIAKNKENEEAITALRTTAETELDLMVGKIEAWSTRWQTEIATLIAQLDALIAKIREMQAAQAGAASLEEAFSIAQGYNVRGDYAEGYDAQYGADTNIAGAAAKAAQDSEAYKQAIKNAATYLGVSEGVIQGFMTSGGITLVDGKWVKWDASKGERVPLSQSIESNFRRWQDDPANYKPMFTGGYVKNRLDNVSLAEKGPEIVLNASDTENFLAAIQIMRDSIQAHLASLGMKQAGLIGGVHSSDTETNNNQTPVIIQADFPNVSAREEIEAAFANLVNQAAQYQLKPRG